MSSGLPAIAGGGLNCMLSPFVTSGMTRSRGGGGIRSWVLFTELRPCFHVRVKRTDCCSLMRTVSGYHLLMWICCKNAYRTVGIKSVKCPTV